MRHIFQLSNYTISWIFSNFSGYLSNLPPSHFFKLHPPSIKHTVNHYDGEIVIILSDFSIKINLCISHDGAAKGGGIDNSVSTGYHPVLIRWVYILMLSKHLLPPRTTTLLSLFIIVTYTTITIPLTETTYIVVIIIVTIDSVSSSLTVTSHNTITVIVPCNSICSTLTKSFTHDFSSWLFAKYTILLFDIYCLFTQAPLKL